MVRVKSPNFRKRCEVVFSILKTVTAPSVDHISTGKVIISNVLCYVAGKVYDFDVNTKREQDMH